MERLSTGEELGGYRLDEVLGIGGMGSVYLATERATGDRLALKVLSPEIAADEAFRRRFLRESRYARSVEHPNIVRVRDSGESRGLLFMAMDYVQGADLATLLRREGPLEPARAVWILAQVADALDAVHAAGLVHRDVKPANCIVTGSAPVERALLTDFGVSKSPTTDSVSLTVAGDFVGTHFYTAPEQLFGDPDPRADVYSLGCMLHECVSGQPPFAFGDVAAVLEAHVDREPPSLRHLRPDLPEGLAVAVTRALAKTPGERFQTCAALTTAAARALGMPEHPSAGTLVLAVTEGGAAGSEIEVASELVIGRGLDGPGGLGGDPQLSRRHARIVRGQNGFFVEDLGSTNGTLKNGQAIVGPAPVGEGDVLELGATRLAVRAPAHRPGRLSLRFQLDPAAGRAGIGVGAMRARLVLRAGAWRLASE